MSIDYIVASLPALRFDAPAPISWGKFVEIVGDETLLSRATAKFSDLDTQLKNALAEARVGNSDFARPAEGCSLYWKNRIFTAFQEKDVAKREELLDKVRWDAAGELTPPEAPLGKGALATYAIRLGIALKRGAISTEAGNAAFDRLTAETKVVF